MTPAMVGRSFTTEIQRVELFIANRVLCYLNGAETFGGQDSAEREQVSPGLVFAFKLNSFGWGFADIRNVPRMRSLNRG